MLTCCGLQTIFPALLVLVSLLGHLLGKPATQPHPADAARAPKRFPAGDRSLKTAAITYTDGRTLPQGTQGAAPRSEAGSLQGHCAHSRPQAPRAHSCCCRSPVAGRLDCRAVDELLSARTQAPRQADGDLLLGAPGR